MSGILGRPITTIRHAMPGEPIEIVIAHDGRETTAVHGDDYLLGLAARILEAVCSNRAAKRRDAELKDMRRDGRGPDMARNR